MLEKEFDLTVPKIVPSVSLSYVNTMENRLKVMKTRKCYSDKH